MNKVFVWGISSIISVVILLLLTILAHIDGSDIVYAMLSGSIVGLIVSTLALAKGVQPQRAVFIIFASISAASGSWLFALILLKITTVSLYNTTALAFDLIVGLVGAASLSYYLLGEYAGKTDGA